MRDKHGTFWNAYKWCFENTEPEMACTIHFFFTWPIDDLKVLECATTMHNYIGF